MSFWVSLYVLINAVKAFPCVPPSENVWPILIEFDSSWSNFFASALGFGPTNELLILSVSLLPYASIEASLSPSLTFDSPSPGVSDPGFCVPGFCVPGFCVPGFSDPGVSVPGALFPGFSDPGVSVPGALFPGFYVLGFSVPGALFPGLFFWSFEPQATAANDDATVVIPANASKMFLNFIISPILIKILLKYLNNALN
ncbi:hypothetical protein GE118_00800 [Mycoplasma sp. NEAQ87857]|uniref:hypothetical protein n=1 Tax=Mycoplasma sp. NEAQ87857 TaxID=2683967 RepID=UPI0013169F4D|nr:hypothetical protein [Mycoplasma sp. NEAQ87857]QGZ97340.1 hypothetical protein GE118_00800 [Mycoplasma sp. NEAQ87857]